MCGVCGFVSEKHLDIRGMISTLRHRGPDHQGVYESGPVSLGHARLSILDLSKGANQPMTDRHGRYTIVYNGEVYNFPELKKELESQGVRFVTHSDTEVVLEGYARWGNDLLPRLNGMFAFAVYDEATRQLVLARDRFGIKPLYYHLDGGELVFGSEIKALRASGRIPGGVSMQGLHEYLQFSTTLGETTFYEGVKGLLPGHALVFDVDRRSARVEPYRLNYELDPVCDSLDEAAGKIARSFEQSVRRQLVSDVPVGVFLSGGIDSAAITAMASRHSTRAVKTFSAGFDFDQGVNELPNARFVSEYFGTDHHEFHIRGADIPVVLEQLNGFFDQPFADAANIPLYLMSRELRGKCKVVLQGDGGDELFAGYRRYRWARRRRGFELISRVLTASAPLVPRSSRYYRGLRPMLAMASRNPAEMAARIYSQEMPGEPPSRLFRSDWREGLEAVDPFARPARLHSRFAGLDLLQELLYTDMNVILPDQYLVKVDRATMANSLEVRVPFLDNELAAYVMALPSEYKVRGRENKYLLKKALSGTVPDRVLYGPKRGFSVPFKYWLKGPMKDYAADLINSTQCYNDEVNRLLQEHASGRRNHGYILWKLLNLSIWLKANG